MGGIVGRTEATGKGVVCAIKAACERLGLSLDGARVAIQGYGNVGSATATLLDQMGCKIVAVSDISGGLYAPDGLNIPELNQHVANHPQRLIEGYTAPGVQAISNEELLALDVDILIPAALEGMIRADNAGNVQAKIVAELANGPTTPEADDILFDRGVQIIPDILANAGGVTVSYFEWVQDRQGYFWNERLVNGRLEEIMVDSFRDVVARAEEHKVNNRIGAYMLALDRVASVLSLRGIYA